MTLTGVKIAGEGTESPILPEWSGLSPERVAKAYATTRVPNTAGFVPVIVFEEKEDGGRNLYPFVVGLSEGLS